MLDNAYFANQFLMASYWDTGQETLIQQALFEFADLELYLAPQVI